MPRPKNKPRAPQHGGPIRMPPLEREEPEPTTFDEWEQYLERRDQINNANIPSVAVINHDYNRSFRPYRTDEERRRDRTGGRLSTRIRLGGKIRGIIDTNTVNNFEPESKEEYNRLIRKTNYDIPKNEIDALLESDKKLKYSRSPEGHAKLQEQNKKEVDKIIERNKQIQETINKKNEENQVETTKNRLSTQPAFSYLSDEEKNEFLPHIVKGLSESDYRRYIDFVLKRANEGWIQEDEVPQLAHLWVKNQENIAENLVNQRIAERNEENDKSIETVLKKAVGTALNFSSEFIPIPGLKQAANLYSSTVGSYSIDDVERIARGAANEIGGKLGERRKRRKHSHIITGKNKLARIKFRTRVY